jgi:FAD/FMN-containing dehydrogenase
MSKVAHYLQEHLVGEVTDSPEVRLHFSKDASILRQAPAIVVYPRTESDVRKTARFAWQLAERGRVMPITARGAGSDTSGAAIGSGILLVFTAHMNRILSLDAKKEFVVIEPGIVYDKLEQTLFTHGMFFPPYPHSMQYATVGGGIANNAIGEKSVKYGDTGSFVHTLRVVLANGEIIATGKLNKRELNKKLGLTSFEGEIYRSLDTLLEENTQLITQSRTQYKSLRNAAGYNIFDIKQGNQFDLTPLFVGSQGSLGIITEAELGIMPHNPLTKLFLVSLESIQDLNELLPKILELRPSVLDMVNQGAIYQITKNNPNQLRGLLEKPNAAIHLFVEFDDDKDGIQKKSSKRLLKVLERFDCSWQSAEKREDQERIWKVRQSVSTLMTEVHGQSKSVPVAEDVAVPIASLAAFLGAASQIYQSANLAPAAWGQAGEGIVRMHPLLDLSQVGDRQKLFKITNTIYETSLKMGGTTTASAGDGRIRAPYLRGVYGDELYNLMMQVKNIFDPHGILNPGVKTANAQDVKEMMRGDYSLSHLHNHLPRS